MLLFLFAAPAALLGVDVALDGAFGAGGSLRAVAEGFLAGFGRGLGHGDTG
jgi:hypothetical protein